MKVRNMMVAAGLLSVLAFVQYAAAQDPVREDGKRGNAGQNATQNNPGAGQNATQNNSGVSRGQTDVGARTDGGQLNTNQDNFNQGQFDNNRGGQFNYNRDGERYYGRRVWRGNRWYNDNGYYGNQNPAYYGGQYGQESGYYSPEMSGQGFAMGSNRVLIRLFVPNPEAHVWFEGSPTEQTGSDRLYISPPIDPGKNYSYTIKATWMENGKEVTKEQNLPVRANQQAMASFDPRFDGNRRQQQDQLPLPSTSTARREDTLGRPEMQEQDRNPSATGQNKNEKATKIPDFVAGKIVSVTGDRLTISEADGGNQRTFQIPNDTQITQNGQKVGNETLKPGMQVSINLKAGTKDTASRVEVTSSAPTDRK
jgi:uncharacterized protein (TIGR03000 family)